MRRETRYGIVKSTLDCPVTLPLSSHVMRTRAWVVDVPVGAITVLLPVGAADAVPATNMVEYVAPLL